ncbi:unnamed protein product (macronuclear) [Paramecium tetraurelia]|uniref:Uncharacterized protein n=1 Tax=Paramecium tetraurelia TaxID=5888 RepID=A0E5F2_PARTE|nr:uncharacterized protein GSPATT00003380001 [Paramecium tetraurelia]CAK90519.1 unnamed protein product [Paramecium tetraurelia]|eukprot:XP_001457916.1 hypothetical protein (macronuclear) [Paramecium tetraurelia strain d4-2]
MILQLINYPVEGTVEQDHSKSPKKRAIIIKHFRYPMKTQTNNLIFPLRSPQIISSKSSTRQNEINWFSDSNLIKEHNQTFCQSNNFKSVFKLGSEQKNRFAIIKKVFKKEDEKDCLFIERKLSLLKFNFKEKEKEKEESQKISIDYSPVKIPQTAQSTRKKQSLNDKNKYQLFQNKINRRFNSDTDLSDQKPNRKKIISYSIRPNTHNYDRDHQEFAQSILNQYLKKSLQDQ